MKTCLFDKVWRNFITLLIVMLAFGVSVSTYAKKKETKRPKIGLVLGGGGAKGAAEVGVLKYIEQVGIPIDYIAGTSIGSIVGGLYSSGYRSGDLDTLFKSQAWVNLLTDRKDSVSSKAIFVRDGVTYVFGFPIRTSGVDKIVKKFKTFFSSHLDSVSLTMVENDSIYYASDLNTKEANQKQAKEQNLKKGDISALKSDVTSSKKLSKEAKKVLRSHGIIHGDSILSKFEALTNQHDSISFDDLPIPYRCVAVDILQMKEIVFKDGNLPFAMRASMSIPGVFKAIPKDSMLLVDGGMLNNLPVDVVRAMGADIVIAVDLTQNKREEHLDSASMKSFSLQGSRFKRMIHWVKERPDLIKYNRNIKDVDIYINPDLKGFSAADFKRQNIIDMIKCGEKAGAEALPLLEELARELRKYKH